MNEKERDLALRIHTTGRLELVQQSVHYNRYEATPYVGLDELFTLYQLRSTDILVDFGCGKGRVPFYVHNRFGAGTVGIEMNGQLYEDAMKNKKSYLQKKRKSSSLITFQNCLAEEYEISVEENYFYFFNPFSVQIFIKVIGNIVASVEKSPRKVHLILYYPTVAYLQYLNSESLFTIESELPIPVYSLKNYNERFLVYTLQI